MKQGTIDELNRLEKWFESHDEVDSADCQITYYNADVTKEERKTTLLSYITFSTGQVWNYTIDMIGGDFRSADAILHDVFRAKTHFGYLLAKKLAGEVVKNEEFLNHLTKVNKNEHL